MPPVKDEVSYGTISFSTSSVTSSGARIVQPSNDITLNVTSVQTAPNGPVMETRIYAWNGLIGADYRAMIIRFSGEFDDFTPGNSYNLGLNYTGLHVVTAAGGGPAAIPAFDYVLEAPPSFVTVPFQFESIEINTTAENRKIVGSLPELIYGSDTLRNFRIDINSFGGNVIPLNTLMSFDVDGIPSGSFETQPFTCTSEESRKPGVLQVKAEFTPDSRNPLQSLTFDFVHHSSKLAYTGPVGNFDLYDGLGYTEIKVTAVDQTGKIYQEQKNRGFVVMRKEIPWDSYFNGVSTVFTTGYLLMEFEMELISSDGSLMTITNGNAYYITAH